MVASHIVKSFDEDLKHLNVQISEMGSLVSQQLTQAIQSIKDSDENLANLVIKKDPEINALERQIDDFAIKMIALRQPMAGDLRNIIAAIKVSSHLERMADYAANIAKRAVSLKEMSKIPSINPILKMGEVALKMIKDVTHAYTTLDDELATKVWKTDVEIDEMYIGFIRELFTYMMEDPRNIGPCLQLLFAAKNIERIGDHATNVASMVYYTVHGEAFAEPRPKGENQKI